jgi:hypothetical protein
MIRKRTLICAVAVALSFPTQTFAAHGGTSGRRHGSPEWHSGPVWGGWHVGPGWGGPRWGDPSWHDGPRWGGHWWDGRWWGGYGIVPAGHLPPLAGFGIATESGPKRVCMKA